MFFKDGLSSKRPNFKYSPTKILMNNHKISRETVCIMVTKKSLVSSSIPMS